jgi:acetyltransferase-like isoleucine patch superfamily enzyme
MIIQTLKQTNILKTLYFNFKMLPVKQALKLPVFIGKHTKFISLKGIIKFESPLKSGMIKIGFGSVGIIDQSYARTLIEINGEVVFKGKALFGNGSKISIGKNGILNIGNNFCISASSTIVCFESVTLGNDVLFSWEILLMDTDFHETINTNTLEINHKISKPIFLGNNIWVGTRCTILKGTIIPSNTIVAANTLLNKKFNIEENCLLAGNPASIRKNNIRKSI